MTHPGSPSSVITTTVPDPSQSYPALPHQHFGECQMDNNTLKAKDSPTHHSQDGWWAIQVGNPGSISPTPPAQPALLHVRGLSSKPILICQIINSIAFCLKTPTSLFTHIHPSCQRWGARLCTPWIPGLTHRCGFWHLVQGKSTGPKGHPEELDCNHNALSLSESQLTSSPSQYNSVCVCVCVSRGR